jgi:mono/diheme cytochrome c family protein
VDTGKVLLILVIVFVPAAILWGLFLSRTTRARKPAALLGIPPAMRPGASDDVLEDNRLTRILAGGLIFTVVLAAFIPLYWLPEKTRQDAFQERFDENAIENGQLIFAAPPPLEEDLSPQEFKAEEKALALGQACANCHGAAQKIGDKPTEDTAGGGIANPAFKDPLTGRIVNYVAPPLNNVFTRWDEEVVRFTIERGRPGTPMPAWAVEFGGSMTPQMVDDVISWLKTLPGNNAPPPAFSDDCQKPTSLNDIQCGREIFQARCAVCHGDQGQGKEDPTLSDTAVKDEKTAEYIQGPTWHQGMALWNGDVKHLPTNLHYYTIMNGRRFAFMPPFGEAPSQGIPIPLYPLTDAQIKAVMAYERAL